MKNKCWIFDIDGTLSNSRHRKHWVSSKPKNWAAWNAGMAEDGYHADVIDFINVAMEKHINVIICTGREETYRDITDNWLSDGGIYYERLYMRKAKDYRPDDIVKKEMLDDIRAGGYEPVLAFDDRDRVVKMWRENGVRCFQVAEGNF